MAEKDPLPTGSVLGNYEIDGVAGRGGMGVVYIATQIRPRRKVALKVIAPEVASDPEFRARFEKESEVAAAIEHPNVIPVYEVNEANGLLFIAMRFVAGTDLRDLIHHAGLLAPARAVELIVQVAGGLDAAHAAGLVHRDVKPANVLVSVQGGQEHAYLTDFGLTKRSDAGSGITRTGVVVGTLDYMAPEQLSGDRVDARTDVYALGCVLYEALTGRVPFPRDTEPAKMYAHMSVPPPSPTDVAPVPPQFDAVVARAMAKDPSARYPSAGDLGRAAQAAARGEHLQARDKAAVATGSAAPRHFTSAGKAPATRRAVRTDQPLVRVRGLVKHFPITRGIVFQRQVGAVHAVDGVTFDIAEGETLGIVGETGCGKSTTARLITRLLDPTSGTIEYQGRDIAALGRKELKPFRRDIQMIFQDPYSSLNPRKTVGSIISDPFKIHGIDEGGGWRKRRVQELMETVGLNPEHYNRFPHEFSGGQRQRIGVARALALGPKLIIADEPVSALDVSIQAQILNLLRDLQRDLGLTIVFIAHDLSVVRHMCDRVAVMYLGKIVELADSDALYSHPRHPYTGALLSAVPVPNPGVEGARQILGGDVPSPTNPPAACRFHTRCWKCQEVCTVEEPQLDPKPGGNVAACHFPLTDGQVPKRVPATAAAEKAG
jgi:oligopeptide/dipeptide ABC transporter ATP-binding protein